MDRPFVVIGAGSGIGKKTVETLRSLGHLVIAVYLWVAEVTADLVARAGA